MFSFNLPRSSFLSIKYHHHRGTEVQRKDQYIFYRKGAKANYPFPFLCALRVLRVFAVIFIEKPSVPLCLCTSVVIFFRIKHCLPYIMIKKYINFKLGMTDIILRTYIPD